MIFSRKLSLPGSGRESLVTNLGLNESIISFLKARFHRQEGPESIWGCQAGVNREYWKETTFILEFCSGSALTSTFSNLYLKSLDSTLTKERQCHVPIVFILFWRPQIFLKSLITYSFLSLFKEDILLMPKWALDLQGYCIHLHNFVAPFPWTPKRMEGSIILIKCEPSKTFFKCPVCKYGQNKAFRPNEWTFLHRCLEWSWLAL